MERKNRKRIKQVTAAENPMKKRNSDFSVLNNVSRIKGNPEK